MKEEQSRRRKKLEKKNCEIRYQNMPRQIQQQVRLATMEDQENAPLNNRKTRSSPQQNLHLIEFKQKHTPTEMPLKLTSEKSVGAQRKYPREIKRIGLRQSFTQREGARSPDYLSNGQMRQNFDLNQISYKVQQQKKKEKYDLGLDFRQLKKELVDELKSYQAKPAQKIAQKKQQQFIGLRTNLNLGGPGSAPPGGINRHNSVSQQKLPTFSSRKQNLANPEVISGLMSARVMATPTQEQQQTPHKTIQPRKTEKKQSLKTSDSRKILIELQMRTRLQQARAKQESQLIEQQRVLNNLKNLNLNVQQRCFRSIRTQREHLANFKLNDPQVKPSIEKTRNRNQVQLPSGQETERLTSRGGGGPDFVPAIQLKKQFESRDRRKLKRQQFMNEPKSVNAKSRKTLRRERSPTSQAITKQNNLINRRFRKAKGKTDEVPSGDEFPSRSIVLNIPKAGTLMQQQSREGHDIVQQNQFKCLSQREFSAARRQREESISSRDDQATTVKRRANSALLGTSSKRGQTESSPRRKTLSTHRTINKTITQSPLSRKDGRLRLRKTISGSSSRRSSAEVRSALSMRSPKRHLVVNRMQLAKNHSSPSKNQLPELDQEDLVIYIILTQAATMIQRAFRAYLARKHAANQEQGTIDSSEEERNFYGGSGTVSHQVSIRDESESLGEFQPDPKSKNVPLKVLEAQPLVIEESASSRRQPYSGRSVQHKFLVENTETVTVTPSLKRSQFESSDDNEVKDFSSVKSKTSNKKSDDTPHGSEPASAKQRKHTFSFGVHKASQGSLESNATPYEMQNLAIEPPITSSEVVADFPHPLAHYSQTPQPPTVERNTPEIGGQEPEQTGHFKVGTGPNTTAYGIPPSIHHHPKASSISSDVDPAEIMLVIQMEDGESCDSNSEEQRKSPPLAEKDLYTADWMHSGHPYKVKEEEQKYTDKKLFSPEEGIQSYENVLQSQRKAARQAETGEGEVRNPTKILVDEKKEFVSSDQKGKLVPEQSHLVLAQAGSGTGSASGSGTVISNREQSFLAMNQLNTSNDDKQGSRLQKSQQQHPYGCDTSSLLASLAERTDKIINYSGFVNTTTEDLIEAVECEDSATGTIEKPFDKPLLKPENETRKRPPNLVEPELKSHNTIEEEAEENDSAYLDQANASPKQLMRMISGDEQFNKAQLIKSEPRIASPVNPGNGTNGTEHDSYLAYNNPASNTVHSKSLADAANVTSSSHHLLQMTGRQSDISESVHNKSDIHSQSHFLATNASIFERNPFQEYTQSKLRELLQNQTSKADIKSMREDALRYGKQIQLAYIERQASKESLSPRSVQRRRYELEEWVTSGRNPGIEDISQVLSERSKPRSPTSGFNLEVERTLTEQIINDVNAKVNQIRSEMQHKKESKESNSTQPTPPVMAPATSPQDPEENIIEEIEKEQNQSQVEGSEVSSPTRSAKSGEHDGKVHPRIQEKGEASKIVNKLEGGDEIINDQDSDRHSATNPIMTGVDTSIDAIEQYIEGILSQIRARAEQFLHAFYTPIYKDPLKMLAQVQKTPWSQNGEKPAAAEKEKEKDKEGDDGEEDEEDLSNTLSSILNVELYLTLERARENMIRDALAQIREQAGSQQDFDSELSGILSEADHIHNKSVFDAINEALNLVRPYGSKGEPMPWSSAPRRSFFVYADEEHLEKILNGVRQNVYQWATTRAGQISTATVVLSPEATKKAEGDEDEGERSTFVASQLVKQTQHAVSEETLLLNREKVLSKLVAKEITCEEPKWTDFEYEETQCKLDVADLVFEQLVAEAVGILNTVQGERAME